MSRGFFLKDVSDTTEEVPVFMAGTGRTALRARLLPLGKDLVVTVSGGETHIGAAALGEPYPSREKAEAFGASVSLLTRITHKEDRITADFAEKLTTVRGRPVVVVCGIHLEEITAGEIREIEANAEKLLNKLISAFDKQPDNYL